LSLKHTLCILDPLLEFQQTIFQSMLDALEIRQRVRRTAVVGNPVGKGFANLTSGNDENREKKPEHLSGQSSVFRSA
jgi:hypothetical protein